MRQAFPHQPALDGIRAIAVMLVLLFHAGLPFVPAGYLGVSVFFTLSGYLITGLLLVENARTGTVRIGAFYGRRVKRLLPASTLCIAGVVVARQLGAFADVTDLRSDVVGAVLQVFNWVQLGGSGSYGDLFGSATSPLEHYWSLAIEEQFYWLWPVVVLIVTRLARRRRLRGSPGQARRRLTVLLTVATVMVSVIAVGIGQIAGPDAAYWSTPARLPEILIGAWLAVVLHRRQVPANAARLALPSLAAILAASMLLPSDHGPAYDGWLPVFAVLSAVLVYSMQADGSVRRILSTRPMVAIGTISYGLYLFHWPVFVVLRERGWTLTEVPHLAAAIAITVVIALASYRIVERPVRRLNWRPLPTLRMAGMATAVVLASAVLVAPSAPAIRADDRLLDAAAIAPAVAGGTLLPLVASSPGPVTTEARRPPVVADRPDASGDTASDGTELGDSTSTTTTTLVTLLELPPTPPRPVRILVVGDSTALYVAQGLAAWTMSHPDHAQVSVSWCQGCTFVLDADITSFDLDDVLTNSQRTITQVMPDAIERLQPDVVVMMATMSEAANRQWSAQEGPIGPTDARAQARIADAYANLTMGVVSAGVPDVVWVVPPTPSHLWNEPEMNEVERYDAHHQIIRDVVSRFGRHVSLVDLDAWARATGRFDDDTWRADGVHIDVGPATELAEQFLGPWLMAEALRTDR